MAKPTKKNTSRALHEQRARYVVGTEGQPVAVLLTLEEYDRYLDLLDDEADSQDADLVARLAQASVQRPHPKRQSFRDYVHRRGASRGPSYPGT